MHCSPVRAPGAVEVTVVEGQDRLGGKIRTTPFAGVPAVDEGPDAFFARLPWATGFARDSGSATAHVAATRIGRRVVGRAAADPRRPDARPADRRGEARAHQADQLARQAAGRDRGAPAAHVARAGLGRCVRACPLRRPGARAAGRPARRQHLRGRHRPLQPRRGAATGRPGRCRPQCADRGTSATVTGRHRRPGVLRADGVGSASSRTRQGGRSSRGRVGAAGSSVHHAAARRRGLAGRRRPGRRRDAGLSGGAGGAPRGRGRARRRGRLGPAADRVRRRRDGHPGGAGGQLARAACTACRATWSPSRCSTW
jgi:hypothetical protein